MSTETSSSIHKQGKYQMNKSAEEDEQFYALLTDNLPALSHSTRRWQL